MSDTGVFHPVGEGSMRESLGHVSKVSPMPTASL